MYKRIKGKIRSGKRLTRNDALKLFESDDIFFLGAQASFAAEKKNGQRAYFIKNRHINPTNICINRCRFCAFSRSKGEEGAFELTSAEIIRKLSVSSPDAGNGGSGKRNRKSSPVHPITPFSEVHIVGGLHPGWPFAYYREMISVIRRTFPELHIKAFTAVEIDYFSRIAGLSLEKTLVSLKESGLDLMPGGGAEIFDPVVRKKLCPEKISGKRWLEVMEIAHRVGIKTNATMLYGHIENYAHRVDHLLKLRELQDKTGGFQAFIPLSFHPRNTQLQGRYSFGIEDLKTIAVSRLMLDNFDHIKAYWIMLGEKISQLALVFGADDIDGTIIEEKITHAAGALTHEHLTVDQLVAIIQKAGKVPVERDAFYTSIKRYS
ncbi:MAG: CofH family radical SAM protein [Nitrospiraceae bacterium]|nr:MAG: CofH family radical SAM protein [Nitrospiraceae bacterium]